MPTYLLYSACRWALLGAAVGGVTHHLYITLRQQGSRLPLAKGSGEDTVTAWAIGAVVGQLAVGLPWLVYELEVPLSEALITELLALPFLSPLYVPAVFPKGRRWVAQNVPYLLGGAAALTTVVVYIYSLTSSDAWASVWLATAAMGLNLCGLLAFTFSNRHNATILYLTRRWHDQGVEIPCGTALPVMHMVFADVLALLLVCEAGGLFSVEWWVLCVLTIAAAPALPNVLSQHNQRPVDIEMAIWVHLGAMGVIFILTLMFPFDPAAWAMANQLWVCHAQDWKTLVNFEEETRTPPAWPFQGVLLSPPPSEASEQVVDSNPLNVGAAFSDASPPLSPSASAAAAAASGATAAASLSRASSRASSQGPAVGRVAEDEPSREP